MLMSFSPNKVFFKRVESTTNGTGTTGEMTTALCMQNLSEIYTRLYIAFLKSFIYDDVGSNIPTSFEHRETVGRRHEISKAERADSIQPDPLT
jgi:hypothetical protein